MLEIAQQAARLWGVDGAQVTLAARRENVVFRVSAAAGAETSRNEAARKRIFMLRFPEGSECR